MAKRRSNVVVLGALVGAVGCCVGDCSDCGGLGDLNDACGVDAEGMDQGACRAGLRCEPDCDKCERTCKPRGDSPVGMECEVSEECAGDAVCLYMDGSSECAVPHTGVVGDPCEDDVACERRLICGGASYDGRCIEPGTLDDGERCEEDVECRRGSRCAYVCESSAGRWCDDDGDCAEGLLCADHTCVEQATASRGDSCTITAQCQANLYCDERSRSCSAAGTRGSGDMCRATGECMAGLVCDSESCTAAGDGAEGDACSSLRDCRAGLQCEQQAGEGTCVVPSPCIDDRTEPIAYFEVPGDDEPVWEFYRLPFPNDVRAAGGRIDLSGHTRFEAPINSDALISDLEQTVDGFSVNPVIHFRFTRAVDLESVTSSSVGLVDVTSESPTYGEFVPLEWTFERSQTTYSCGNRLSLSPPVGITLRPSTTYAAILTTAVRSESGASFERDADFELLLSDAATDALESAHAAYAPLRSWLADASMASGDLISAAVFTTQAPELGVSQLRVAVHRDFAPRLTDVTICDGVTTSSCEVDGRGACSIPDDAFLEVHGRIELPIYQHGTPPYQSLDQGGSFRLGPDAVPELARTEAICFALAIPRERAGDVIPLVITGHGTGGSFTGYIRNGIAGELATGQVDGTAITAATLSFDLPEHGERRGDTDTEPEKLFFNFSNPLASRSNVLQGASDYFALVHWASDFEPEAIADAIGSPLQFDPRRIAMLTHSQGSTHASLMLPYEPNVVAAVLSGNGGHLVSSLLTKTEPEDVAGLTALGLLDLDPDEPTDSLFGGSVASGRFNPMLALFQTYFDSVDPVNFAYRLHSEPWLAPPQGAHVFMTYGLEDNYSTEPTLQAFARAASFTVVTPVLVDFGLPQADPPLRGNISAAETTRTVGLRQYSPDPGDDGHFVATRTTAGRRDAIRFLLEALAGQTPAIGP